MNRIKMLFLVLIAIDTYAVELKSEAQTWEFAEKNAVLEVKDKLETNKTEISKRADDAKKEVAKKIKDYKDPNTVKLQRAVKNRVFNPDMRYTLNEDLKDAKGRVLYPKGYTFSPLEYVTLMHKIVVFDPTDKAQLEWYKKSGHNNNLESMILITDGSGFKMSEKFNRPLFFLTKPIVERFKLKYTPCIIEQRGNKIVVNEFAVGGGKDE